MKILGIDPGYAIIGYGIIEYRQAKFKPIEYGAIVTEKEENFNVRLEHIYDSTITVMSKCKIDALSIEKLFFNSNQKTAIGVAEARGVILLAAQKSGIPIFEYTPLQVKSAVTGYGRAEKGQVMEMTRRFLGLRNVPKPDDTADALAVAICHAQSGGNRLKRILNKTEG